MTNKVKMDRAAFAELRKLRKREKAFLNALDLIELCPDADKKSIVDNCRKSLKEIDKKEDFLHKLETPKSNPATDAEDILVKIRARANMPPTTTTYKPRTLLQQIKDAIER